MPLKLSPAGDLQVYVWSWRNYPPYDEITSFDGSDELFYAVEANTFMKSYPYKSDQVLIRYSSEGHLRYFLSKH
jgi:hypothetical protein